VILVTIGTHETPFDRLLTAVGPLVELDDLVVQYGSSDVRVRGARCVAFLPFDELTQLVGAARVVVTHAGAGSVLVTLATGKRPVVMPRLASFGEAVDDHQLVFGRHLSRAGLVTVVEDAADMKGTVERAGLAGAALRGPAALSDDLSRYLRAALGGAT
jgi:UDP-N-acetylglucosamine transferase subunit ALG13